MRYLSIILIVLLLNGCATKHYGRQGTLTNYEKETLTCREIKLEIAKIEGFIDYINDKSRTIDGKEVLAFLGDFGIGNVIEAYDARESADIRILELIKLQLSKECAVSDDFKAKYKHIIPRKEIIKTFNEEEAKNIFLSGNNTITGSVYYGDTKNGNNNTNTCTGVSIHLLPDTEYTKERFIFITGSEYDGYGLISEVPGLSKLNPLSLKYRQTVKCNNNGNFEFENISDGSFYLLTSYQKNNQEKSSGMIMKKVFVSNGETKNVLLSKK